ncbi:type II toxin-antitoxin system VapC family toxin [Tundrisphaera lichenicola]|uniref:type II toxin-antitoxin system VapC family toxin n=1 Tax=Tundrisphaera lichenicola TaxID=2029860 RepID=UPI003EBD2306
MSGVTERLVLDGSLTLAWYFSDETDPYADAVALGLATRQAVVPSLWRLEIANTLVVVERRKRSTEAQAAAFIARLQVLPIVIDDETDVRAWSETIRLARAHTLSAYDAAYLELAMRRGLPLASLDDELKAAAKAVGVPLFTV